MNIIFEEASKDDIEELIRLRIAYMIDDFGGVSDHERECMEKQLPDYFNRKGGTYGRLIIWKYIPHHDMGRIPWNGHRRCGRWLSGRPCAV